MSTTPNIFKQIWSWFLVMVGRLISWILMDITVIGLEHAPTKGPLIVTANHFSWFDAPLLTMYLPVKPAFLIAIESQRFFWVRLFTNAFNGIPIWRGRADRKAMRQALQTLDDGNAVGIFPEGGIDPRTAKKREAGELIVNTGYEHFSRSDGELTHAKPGTIYLAVESQAMILPVALIGTENVLNNVFRFRRTPVTIQIGPAFGPLVIESELSNSERKQRMKKLSEEVMMRIARLFPSEKRGPYRNMNLEAF